jgi:hypothetical protein
METRPRYWCGLEVHGGGVNACLLSPEGGTDRRAFAGPDFQELVDWLRQNNCTHVAILPRCDAWKPLRSVLQKSFVTQIVTGQLLEAAKLISGCCCEWVAQLLRSGRLNKADQVEPISRRTSRSSDEALGG